MRDYDEFPPETSCNTRAFNACELCDAPGSYVSESNVKPSHIQKPGRRGQMICINGHYFDPQNSGSTGFLEELERQYMDTFKE